MKWKCDCEMLTASHRTVRTAGVFIRFVSPVLLGTATSLRLKIIRSEIEVLIREVVVRSHWINKGSPEVTHWETGVSVIPPTHDTTRVLRMLLGKTIRGGVTGRSPCNPFLVL